MFVVIAEGRPSIKVVDNQEREVVPFTGTERGSGVTFGAGFYFANEGGGFISGVAAPRKLIRSWRAMKLIEQVPKIGYGTLFACWNAAQEWVHDSEKRYIDGLASQFSSPETFEAIRSDILNAVPTAEEFEQMLTIVRVENLRVFVKELTELIERDELPHHPIVDELVQEEEERWRRYREHKAFVEAPMSPAESLGALFEELGITNVLNGAPFGVYELNWGHIQLSELDTYVKGFSTGEYNEGCWFPLWRTTKDPCTLSAQIAKAVPRLEVSLMKTEKPWCITPDSTYIFLEAAYRDGSIVVKTHVEEKGKEPEVGTYSVQMLRDMIGPPKKKRRRFGRR